MTLSPRIQAIFHELDKAAGEYIHAKDVYESVRVEFEMARVRFVKVKESASEMASPAAFYSWIEKYPHLRYAGMQLGDAINAVLDRHAIDKAFECADDNTKDFNPYLSLQAISNLLEEGGFDFRSTTPLREVNAAVTRLKGITKHPKFQLYASEKADEYLALVRGEEEASVAVQQS